MRNTDVADVLRRAIRQGVLKPGEDLVQEEIAGRLGISRIPLREALRELAAVGVVQMSPGRGFRVTVLDATEIAELYDLRLAIEPPLASRIVGYANRRQVDELAAMEQQMRTAPDPERWANLNYDFHLAMYETAGVRHTLRLIGQLLDLVEPYSRLYVHELHNLERVESEHAGMIEALRAGDGAALSELITRHLSGARQGLVAAMTEQADGDVPDPIHRLIGLGERT